ncbi:protein PHYTOCHROME KINASE SUBSTRATE 4-like [Miscanthus floridulus]|uniref:protein PHYTOCHROME KINASE SUBSTRATE 4-like n=2 Tax=Miscanthus floridulus TaxID=154761 RepID=UPI00345967FE
MVPARAPPTRPSLDRTLSARYSSHAPMPCTDAVPGGVERAYQLEPSMGTSRAPKAKPDHADADDSDELGVFAAERYLYGDDALLWPCERSSSSLSSAFRTGTHDHDRSAPTPTAVTSSSEASWNSRSAMLPNEPAEKLCAVAAATPIVEARPSDAEGQRAGRRTSSSSNLRRWLLGVAACACAGGASEESVSADEMETSERFPETEIPEATAARSSVTPASGRWLLEGEGEGDKTTLAGMDGHRRATNKGEVSTPILHPQAAATSDSDERRRIKSLEMFRPVPVPVGDRGSALGSATQSSAFTIVAGNTALGGDAPRTASGGGGSPGEDDAAPSELGCAYPPSEASVVWSVVTADGAASGNFSSAASGYYYHCCFNDVDEGAMRAAARNTHKRRSVMRTSLVSI